MLASQALRSFLMGLELWKYIVIQFRSKAHKMTIIYYFSIAYNPITIGFIITTNIVMKPNNRIKQRDSVA